MTKQEAIGILRDTPIDIRSTREDDIHTLYATAQGMAIEALQHGCEKVAEGCEDYITVKRQFVLDAINIGLSGYISDDDKLTLEGMGIAVSELPSAQPENTCEKTCEITRMSQEKDTIYRQDVIDMIQGVPISSGTTKAMLIFRAKELPSAQPDLLEDGTLMITVPNEMLNDVKRVMVDEVDTKFCKVMYQDEPEQRWIPVSERLPEQDGNYLVTFQLLWLRPIEVCMFSNGQWDKGGYEKVLAWQPLPESYKGEEDDTD